MEQVCGEQAQEEAGLICCEAVGRVVGPLDLPFPVMPRRTSRGAGEEGGSKPLERRVAPDARHVADVLGLQGGEEVLGRKTGVHPEPELFGEPLQLAERCKDEIESTRYPLGE